MKPPVNGLRALRYRLRLSQRELARRCRVDRALIGRWESGALQPTPAQYGRLVAALDVPPLDLYLALGRVRQLTESNQLTKDG